MAANQLFDQLFKPAAAPGFSSPLSLGYAPSLFAKGGIMTGRGPVPLRRYAGGGIASRPQLALFGEGSRPEAFVPLADGARIPVRLQLPDLRGLNGSRGAASNVTIKNYPGMGAVERRDAAGNVEIEIIRDVIAGDIADRNSRIGRLLDQARGARIPPKIR